VYQVGRVVPNVLIYSCVNLYTEMRALLYTCDRYRCVYSELILKTRQIH
jgi:hypothetical protein